MVAKGKFFLFPLPAHVAEKGAVVGAVEKECSQVCWREGAHGMEAGLRIHVVPYCQMVTSYSRTLFSYCVIMIFF